MCFGISVKVHPGLEDSPGALLPSPKRLQEGCLGSPLGDRSKAPGESSSPGWQGVLLDHLREDVALAQDLDLLALDLDVAAGVAAVDDLVAGGDGQGGALAVVQQLAGADREHAAALRLLLGAVGQQDAARGLLLRLQRL